MGGDHVYVSCNHSQTHMYLHVSYAHRLASICTEDSYVHIYIYIDIEREREGERVG